MISIRDIAWFAGLYEGEGSVLVESTRLAPRLRIDMTDRDVLERAAVMTGGRIHGYESKTRQELHPQWKPAYSLVVNGPAAIGWLMTIYSLLGMRRRAQIRKAVNYWRARKRQPGGWTAHHARYGCNCQARSTGSCQKKRAP